MDYTSPSLLVPDSPGTILVGPLLLLGKLRVLEEGVGPRLDLAIWSVEDG